MTRRASGWGLRHRHTYINRLTCSERYHPSQVKVTCASWPGRKGGRGLRYTHRFTCSERYHPPPSEGHLCVVTRWKGGGVLRYRYRNRQEAEIQTHIQEAEIQTHIQTYMQCEVPPPARWRSAVYSDQVGGGGGGEYRHTHTHTHTDLHAVRGTTPSQAKATSV